MVFPRLLGTALTAASLSFVLTGCATLNVPDIGSGEADIYEDEQRLINRAKEAEEVLDRSRFLYEDEAIEAYLTRILNKLHPEGTDFGDITLTVKVVKDPSLNAITFPNGRIYMFSGILASAENESQVATVLAHEVSHVLGRHVLKEFRSLKNKTAFWQSFGLMTGGLGMIVSELAKVSSINGFSQEMETEADEKGFELLKTAGFDVTQAPLIFEKMDAYLKGEKIKESYFFSSHPKLVRRIRNFERLVKEAGSPETGSAADPQYQELVHELVIENMKICMDRGMFMTLENQLLRMMKVYPDDVRIPVIKGELYKERYDRLS